jgi:hypothetical protein
MPVVRISWEGFPNVAVHTRRAALKAHPALAKIYASAKLSNVQAARAPRANEFTRRGHAPLNTLVA